MLTPMISETLLFLVQAAIVIAVPYFLWTRHGVRHLVPLVVVQISVGIVLGPSILGALSPETWQFLFPPGSLANINGLAWIAVLFFAFLTGLHFDLTEIRDRSLGFSLIALSSVATPTILGAAAGYWLLGLYPEAMGENGTSFTFLCGMGVAAGVTALPVLGAVLREMHMTQTPLGQLALGCAAVNDAVLWALVAGLFALSAGGDWMHALYILAAAGVYVAAMHLAVRPLLERIFAHAIRHRRINERDVVVMSSLLFASAMATEAIGIHYIIGAFAFGTIMPKAVAKDVLVKFESIVTVILLPFFFIATGLKTSFDMGSTTVFVIFGVMTLASVVGKMAGTVIPAWATGHNTLRDSFGLGSFILCKGLMELVILTMLLDAGIISPLAFSGMIFMAILATAMTKPLVTLILRPKAHPGA